MDGFGLNLEQLRNIASACQASSNRLNEEAQTVRTQLANFEEAIRGVPQLAQADRFDQLNQMLTQLSEKLDESNTYVRGIVTRAEEFADALRRGA